MLLKLQVKAGTGTDGYKPVASNLRWDTASLRLAGTFENRAVGAKPIHFGRRLDEFKEGICTKQYLR